MGMGSANLLRLLRILGQGGSPVNDQGPDLSQNPNQNPFAPVMPEEDSVPPPVFQPRPMPMRDNYSRIVNAPPQHEKPRGLTKAGMILGGAIEGFLGKPNSTAEIMNARDGHKIQDYQLREHGAKTLADLEEKSLVQDRLLEQARNLAADRDNDNKRLDIDMRSRQADRDEDRQSRIDIAKQLHEDRMSAAKNSAEQREADRDLRKTLAEIAASAKKDKSDKHQLTQDAQGRNIIADLDDPSKSVFLNTPGTKDISMGKVGDTTRKASDALDDTLTKATQLKTVVEKYRNTLAIGPVTGAISKSINSNIYATKDKSDMYRLMQDLANRSLYEMSGAQINNKEFERLRETLADPNTPEEKIFSDLQAFIDSGTRQRERFKARGVWDEEASSSDKLLPGSVPTSTVPTQGIAVGRFSNVRRKVTQ